MPPVAGPYKRALTTCRGGRDGGCAGESVDDLDAEQDHLVFRQQHAAQFSLLLPIRIGRQGRHRAALRATTPAARASARGRRPGRSGDRAGNLLAADQPRARVVACLKEKLLHARTIGRSGLDPQSPAAKRGPGRPPGNTAPAGNPFVSSGNNFGCLLVNTAAVPLRCRTRWQNRAESGIPR